MCAFIALLIAAAAVAVNAQLIVVNDYSNTVGVAKFVRFHGMSILCDYPSITIIGICHTLLIRACPHSHDPCSTECSLSLAGDVHTSTIFALGTCYESTRHAGEYEFYTQGDNSNQFVRNANCSSTCTNCQWNETFTLNTCAPSIYDHPVSKLITSSVCTGGEEATNKDNTGAVFTLFSASTQCNTTAADFTNFVFGNNYTCLPFLLGTYGQLTPNGDGNYTANLLCNSTCGNCAVNVENAFGCLPISLVPTGSWNIQTLGQLSSCGAPSPSSSKLSTGAIVGIAVGGSVGVIGAVAVGSYLVKANRRAGYTTMGK